MSASATWHRLVELVRGAGVIVFDFDGTLVDSNAIKWRAFDRCFAQFPEHRAEIQTYCHAEHHVPRWEKFRHVYERIVGLAYTPHIEAALSAQFERDTTQDIIAAQEIPGAASFVAGAAASGRVIGLLSNTPHAILERILERRGWRSWFTHVQGAPVRKADWLARCKAAHALSAPELVFFGDTPEDARAAEEAGCLFIGIGAQLEGKAAHWSEDFTRLNPTAQPREAGA